METYGIEKLGIVNNPVSFKCISKTQRTAISLQQFNTCTVNMDEERRASFLTLVHSL